MILAYYQKNTSKIKKLFSKQESIPWLYLGRNYINRCSVEKDLGSKFRRIDISKLHDTTAKDIRKEHVQWIDKLNIQYGSDVEWWFGAISSRNIYESNLFQYSCYLEILERLHNEKRLPEIIILESLGLAKAIKKWAIKKNVSLNLIHQYKARQEFVINRLYFLLRYFKSLNTLLLRWLAAKISKINSVRKKLNSGSIILSTYLHDNDLSDDGFFSDRYFPYLHEYFREKEKNVVIYPLLYGFGYNYVSIYKRMRQSKIFFIIAEDHLSFTDYFKCLTYPLSALNRKIEADDFRQFDMTDILKQEKLQAVGPSINAILTYRLFLRLGKIGLQPKLFITWYENQVIDKALIAGARQGFPQTKIVGAQMFIHPPNHLNLFPSQSEIEARFVPDVLIETSQHQCKIAKSFANSIPCKPAAALRYSHIFEDGSDNGSPKEKNQNILVLLPHNISEAVELLDVLNESLFQIGDKIKIFIKTHPDYSLDELIKIFGSEKWPKRFEIFQDSVSKALDVASIVISSNSSSMVEAAVKGVPVIFLGRQTALNQNVLANAQRDIITECFSSSELVTAINQYLDSLDVKKDEYKKIGLKLRETFFTPVTEQTLEPFLN